jgi:hypothetical protein
MEHEFDAGLAYELMNMAEEGRAVWAAVSTEDPLFHGHHPVMEELCRRNAERLNVIFDSVGWPGGWAADWVLYHAIWSPDVMRRGLGLLRAAQSASGRRPRGRRRAPWSSRAWAAGRAHRRDPGEARRQGARAPADRAARMGSIGRLARMKLVTLFIYTRTHVRYRRVGGGGSACR